MTANRYPPKRLPKISVLEIQQFLVSTRTKQHTMPFSNQSGGSLAKALKGQVLAHELEARLDLSKLGQARLPMNIGDMLVADEKQKMLTHIGSASAAAAAAGLVPRTVRDALKLDVSAMAAVEAIAKSDALESLTRMTSAYDFLDEMTKNQLTGSLSDLAKAKEIVPRLEPIHIPHIPRPEDTKLGRAALDTAEQLQAVVRLNSSMVDQITSLTQLFIGDVFPKWQQKLKDDQEAADEARQLAEADAVKRQKEAQVSLDQANQNLKVAKWALIASVVVSLAMTGWQLLVSKNYREQDAVTQAAQQLKSDAMVIKQQEVLEMLSKRLGEVATAKASAVDPKANLATPPKTGLPK